MTIDTEREFRLQRFWGATIFSIGMLWGFASLVYVPMAEVTSMRGSSWTEFAVSMAGGILTFGGTVGAFYRRKTASRILLIGGVVLLAAAFAVQHLPDSAIGADNVILVILPGIVAIALGIFGIVTERKGWPSPMARDSR